MNHEEFKKVFFDSQPASIKATLEKDGDVSVKIDGRGADLISLSMCIVEDIVKNLPLSIDDYCNILKDGYIARQGIDVFEKLFEDLFDEQKRTDFD